MPPKKVVETVPEPKVFHTPGGEVLVSHTVSEKQLKEIEDLYTHAHNLNTDPSTVKPNIY
jgi:hypothetical protein